MQFMRDNADASEFYEEVLRSYRLIFGQTKESCEIFGELNSRSWDPLADPLLDTLCGKSCESQEARIIFNEINAKEASDVYRARLDFPFLGARLLELQKYVRGKKQKSQWARHDRRMRNPSFRFTQHWWYPFLVRRPNRIYYTNEIATKYPILELHLCVARHWINYCILSYAGKLTSFVFNRMKLIIIL